MEIRTLKQILNSSEHLEEYSIILKNGIEVNGLLIQERVDKSHDTEGYNIYDIRSGETPDGIELMYASLEPKVYVNWADSIATKQTLDFGTDGYLEIDNDDIIEEERTNKKVDFTISDVPISELPDILRKAADILDANGYDYNGEVNGYNYYIED